MPEEIKEEHKEEKKKKGALGKLKDAILPDADEQAAIMSTFVRLGVLVWSGGILTLNYVAIPGVPQQKIDPSFIFIQRRIHLRIFFIDASCISFCHTTTNL